VRIDGQFKLEAAASSTQHSAAYAGWRRGERPDLPPIGLPVFPRARRPLLSRAVARALDEGRVMHGYSRRNQLILSDYIDTQIEVVSAGL
jgi:hypothetical protein